jgi:hypothetical protein
MAHGKIQLMLVCRGLNVAFVEAPPSTNLQQDTMCILKLSLGIAFPSIIYSMD